MSEDLKKTPLHSWHKEMGARMVPYAGWEMPVQYSEGLQAEHVQTRESASLFDVTHMGEFRIKGKEALKCMNFLSPSNISKLEKGESCYSFFPNEKGGVVDDLLIYCFEPETDYLMCVNAANTDKIEAHLKKYTPDFEVELVEEASSWGQIAVQGPKSMEYLEKLFSGVSELKKFSFAKWDYKSQELWVARTGYTGEDGVEIFVPWELTESLWLELSEMGVKPCGLGARDTLRLEASLNLYGNEMDENSNPFERRLGWTVDFSKSEFLAKEALVELKEMASHRLVGLKVLDRAIARTGYAVLANSENCGVVTSGTKSPSLGYPIAMAWIDKKALQGEKEFEIQIRNKKVKAEICPLPFLKNK